MPVLRHCKPLALAALAAAVAGVRAEVHIDYAEVIETRPVYQSVSYAVPEEHCRIERRPAQARRVSATGPILGAIVGGALGNAIGHKRRNKQVGAVVGAALGGSIGYDVARKRRDRSVAGHEVEVCDAVERHRTEERFMGYDVTYRYAGERYTARMDNHPGERIRVRVRVTPWG